MTSCGNGITEPLNGEFCDDGNIIAGDDCSPQCRGETCGNGIIDVGETCEETSSDPKGACGADCLSDLCGNGTVNPGLGEECDPPGPNADPAVNGCNPYCVFVECGNGFVDEGELCDDGNADPGDGCSEQCLSEYCGNGVIDANLGEQCDDHGRASGDRCSAICLIEVCGNGITDTGEECDDANATAGDGCSSACKREVCGNGSVEGSEVCDDGNVDPGDGCSSSCVSEFCGNRVTDRDHGEECDDGPPSAGDGCSAVCRYEKCGNGIIDVQETCDDGNTSRGDGCSELCRSEFCGDGEPDATFGETCDDGNDQPGDGCSEFCRTEVCGNHVLDSGETCDDGNDVSGDGCSANCRSPSIDMSSRIGQKWLALGGGPTVGDATSEVQEAPDGSARYQSFTNGVIVDTGAPQAVYLTHALFSHWLALAGQTAHTGENLFTLVGPPAADFSAQASYQSAQFERGMIVTESGQPVRLVYGDIYQQYLNLPNTLGLPRSDQIIMGTTRRFQQFQSGEIHWEPSSGMLVVNGPIFERWQELGGAAGPLGFPIGRGTRPSGDSFIDFNNGVVVHHIKNDTAYTFHEMEFAIEHIYTDVDDDNGDSPELYSVIDLWPSNFPPIRGQAPIDPILNGGPVCWEYSVSRIQSGFVLDVQVDLWDEDGGGNGRDDRITRFEQTYSIDNLWGKLVDPMHQDNASYAIFTLRYPSECLIHNK